MKFKYLLMLILTVFLSSSMAAENASKAKDRDILGSLVALNKNEISSAQQVKRSKLNPDVKAFANFMIVEHKKNLASTMKLSHTIGKPTKSKETMMLKLKGLKELASLKITSDKNLQKTYIDDMVKDHQDALDMIDNNLLPNVTNAQLKSLLDETRTHVAKHLEKAKAIQSKLDSK